jgi:hypothetical protein
MHIVFECPNPHCKNRALEVGAQTETTVTFTATGTIAQVEHGEWYIHPDDQATCPQCHWDGFAEDCRREIPEAHDAAVPYY